MPTLEKIKTGKLGRLAIAHTPNRHGRRARKALGLPELKEATLLERILPTLLAWITGHVRYRVDIEWSSVLWTHNAFRAYELIFWRKYGIRREASAISYFDKELGKRIVKYTCFTWEARIAYTEARIRNGFRALKSLRARKLFPYRIGIAEIATPSGIRIPCPYLFAIAVDATGALRNSGGGTPISFSLTTSGSDRLLLADSISFQQYTLTLTYNLSSLTKFEGISGIENTLNAPEGFYLNAPATGSNTLAATYSDNDNCALAAVSYTGCSQTSAVIDSHATASTAGATSLACSTTVVLSNCWEIVFANSDQGVSAGTGATLRVAATGSLDNTVFDSNGTVSTGSQSITFNITPSGKGRAVVFSITPPVSNNYTKDLTETIALVDVVKRDTGKILVDAFALVDTVKRDMTKLLTDVFTLVDVVDIIQIFTQALTETITLVDTMKRDTAKILTETVTLVDSAARAAARMLTDTITLVDTATINTFYSKILTDAIALSDSIQKATGKYILDTITLVDTVATRFTAILLTDVFTLVDSQSMIHGFIKMLTETISLNDVLTKTLAYSRRFTESISLSTRLFLNGVNAAWLLKYARKATTWIGKYTDPK